MSSSAPQAALQQKDQLCIKSTITANSISRSFGIPGAIDYRSHPGQREPDAPLTIFKSMKVKEVAPLQDIKFLKGTIYSYKNRKIITRWLRDVCAACSLKATTLALAVQLTDAFIISHLETLPVNRCQLAAVASLWVAAKFEELDDDVPRLKAIVDVCDGAYTTADVLMMEEDILNGFQWRIPHTTSVNYLYLMVHIHSLLMPMPAAATDAVVADYEGNDIVTVDVCVVDADTKQRSYTTTTMSSSMTFLQAAPVLCSAAGIPSSTSIEVYELFGFDFLLAKRVPLSDAPRKRKLSSAAATPQRIRVFVANSSQGSPVFAEHNDVVLLKTINGLLWHTALDILSPEALTHVEFLRLPSHVVALGVLALARCLVGQNVEESRVAIAAILKTLEISGAQALAAADLLCDKYQEVVTTAPNTIPPPVVGVPPDIRDRLKHVFSKV